MPIPVGVVLNLCAHQQCRMASFFIPRNPSQYLLFCCIFCYYILAVHAVYRHFGKWLHIHITACFFFFCPLPPFSCFPSSSGSPIPFSYLLILFILAHVMVCSVFINWGYYIPLSSTSLFCSFALHTPPQPLPLYT